MLPSCPANIKVDYIAFAIEVGTVGALEASLAPCIIALYKYTITYLLTWTHMRPCTTKLCIIQTTETTGKEVMRICTGRVLIGIYR